MNKIEIGLSIGVVCIIIIIGCIIYYEQTSQIEEWMEEHPGETFDIGGPPVITDLRPVVVVVVIAAIFCWLALKTNPDKKKPCDET